MIAMACTLVFAVAAVAAAGTIVSTMLTYGGDVQALRIQRCRGVPELSLAWRILEAVPGAYDEAAAPAVGFRVSGSRQQRPTYAGMQPSLAA
jgi:hypothetical protein